jgi:hypothetical protein
LDKSAVERYMTALLETPVTIASAQELGSVRQDGEIKSYGYGTPVRIDYQAGGSRRSAVLHTIRLAPFGHEDMSDRARALLWSHRAFNRLPRHVPSLDVGAFCSDGALISLGHAEEFCLLTEYAPGVPYAKDLERIRDTGELTPLDRVRAQALCDYLVCIHATRGGDPGRYTRRIRELVGDGECIMGILDSYASHPLAPPELLEEIEHLCVRWRWKLKGRADRLRQVHGDFHPWNILFSEGSEFRLLDRSRGEWGDPADDVASIAANFLFFSLQRDGRLTGPFETLFLDFWRRYLDRGGDRELNAVVAPFFAFRALVMASPAWYPSLPDAVRRALLAFVRAVLERDTFNPQEVNAYCGT